jgi:hypothetical protein
MIYCRQIIGEGESSKMFYFILASKKQLAKLKTEFEEVFMVGMNLKVSSHFYIQRNASWVSAKNVPEEVKKILRDELARTKTL